MGKSVRKVDSSFWAEEVQEQQPKKVDASFWAEDPVEEDKPVKKNNGVLASGYTKSVDGGTSTSPSTSPLESPLPILNNPVNNSFKFLSTFIDKNEHDLIEGEKQHILSAGSDGKAFTQFVKRQKERINNTIAVLDNEVAGYYQESTARLGDMSGGMRRNLMDKVKQNFGAVAKAEVERPAFTDPAVFENTQIQKAAIKKEKKDFEEQLFPAAAMLAYQNTEDKSPKAIGRRVRQLTADETVDRELAWETKGIELRPDQKALNDNLGLSAMEIAVASKLSAVTSETPQAVKDEVLREAAKVQELRRGQFKEHKEFYQGQIAKLIGEEIYKEKNPFQLSTGLYNITDDDIKRIGAKLGMTEEELAGIKDDDIPNESLIGKFYYNFIAKPATDINGLSNRIWGAATGEDSDVITAENEKKSLEKQRQYAVPNAQLFEAGGMKVEADRESGRFLLDVKETEPTKYRTSVVPIATVVAEGFGQILNYGLGAKGVGKVLNVSGLVKSADKAAAVGNFAYTFTTQYEPNYQQAAKFTNSEAERNLFATLTSATTAAVEQFLPDYKIVNNLLAKSLTPKALIDYVSKNGIQSVTKEGLKGYLKSGFQVVKDISKEDVEEEVELISEVALNAIIIPKANEGRNIFDEAINTAIVTAMTSALPISVGGFRSQRKLDNSKDDLLFHLGNHAGTARSEIQKEVDEGKLDATEANRKIQIVNTMEKAVELSSDVPPQQQKRYAANLLKTSLLKEEIVAAKDDDAKVELLNKELQGLIDERKQVLTPVTAKAAENTQTTQDQAVAPVAGQSDIVVDAPAKEEGTKISPEILLEVKNAAQTDLQKIYRAGFIGDIENGLKEAAQQLNASEGEAKTAKKFYGETISNIAKKLFPNETVANSSISYSPTTPSDINKVETDSAIMQGAFVDKVEANDEMVQLPKKGFVISDVNLKDGVKKGKGHGQEVYKAALDKYGTLYSTSPISEDALRAQEALQRKGIATIRNENMGGVDFIVIEKVTVPSQKEAEIELQRETELDNATIPNIVLPFIRKSDLSAMDKVKRDGIINNQKLVVDKWKKLKLFTKCK